MNRMIPIAPISDVTHDISRSPLDAVVHEAGRKLLSLRMTRIVAQYADEVDAQNIAADLDALCSIIDPVIKAIGEYAADHLSIGADVVKTHFTDQLRDTLEGNAAWVVLEAGAKLVRERHEDAFYTSREFVP